MAGAAGAATGGLSELAAGARVNLGFVAAIVAVASVGGFMFGYDSGVINGTQEGLEQAFHLSKLGTGLNVGAILLGCAAGAFGAGRLADVYGRRSLMMASAAAFVLSALLAGAAPASAVFIAARILGGLGVGAASVLSPIYISEVTPASIRERLASVQQVMIITGLTAAFLVNYVLARVAGGSTAPIAGHPAWRWMFWVQVAPAAVFLLSLSTIPESPRHLAADGSTVFFNFSWGPVMWVMLGEMFPNRIRGSALAVAGLGQWGANFLVSVSFPPMSAGLGLPTTYGAYALFAALSFLFVRRFITETRGRELEAMTG